MIGKSRQGVANKYLLLVATVGGTSEPLVKSLLEWRPDRVLFVASEQVRSQVDTVLRGYAEASGQPLNPGQYEVKLISDPEDLMGCVTAIRDLEPEVNAWVRRRGGDYAVVVDFTGGTKCMSAALALASQRWPCRYSYVGGVRRTKEGVGVVESGAERVVHSANPWDALGYQAVEDFIILFDQRSFEAAARVASRAKTRVEDPARKREMAALELLAQAFDSWDRFDHRTCQRMLRDVLKAANDLRAALRGNGAEQLLQALERCDEYLSNLVDAEPPSRWHVIDLLANAKRRKEEGRVDDAVARVYRAIEALAQVALRERHGIDTAKVPLDRVPDVLRPQWTPRAAEGSVMLGLQDAYMFLAALGDPVGKTFQERGLHRKDSPLTARNRSILAHGFSLVGDADFDRLWEAALVLGQISEQELPLFPTLASPMGDST